jgi:hypothetical protein
LYDEARELKNQNAVDHAGDIVRARLNWRTNEELRNMVFDPDGYFTDSIRPLSIETTHLAVGAKAWNFELNGVLIEPNHDGDPADCEISAGSLVHFTVDSAVRTWTLQSNSYTSLTAGTAYYIYARCDKTNYTSANNTVVLDATERSVAGDATYYYFLIGILHSVVDGVRGISLTYGQTTINGKTITTGKIQSANGNTYFDLDNNTLVIGSASGIGNFSDAGAVVTADDLDGIPDGGTYARTTYNQRTGANRAYNAIDSSANVVTSVHPSTSVATPGGTGLFLGSDYLGYYDGSNWKTYMDNSGNFYLGGASGPFQWDAAASSVTVGTQASGQRCVLDGTNNRLEFYDSGGTLRILIDEDATYGNMIQINDTGGTTRLSDDLIYTSGRVQADTGGLFKGNTSIKPLDVYGEISSTSQQIFYVDENGDVYMAKHASGAAGNRTLTLSGLNISLTSGATVDGVDVSSFKSTYDSHAASASSHHVKTTISDSPADGQTTVGISANWAYDHVNAETGSEHHEATSSISGFISDTDQAKLDAGDGVDGTIKEYEFKQRTDSHHVWTRYRSITVSDGIITAIGSYGSWSEITQEAP